MRLPKYLVLGLLGLTTLLVLTCDKSTEPQNPPPPPQLSDPGDIDVDGSYAVSWTAVTGADSYELEEDENASFGNPTRVYRGEATSKTFSDKPDGTFYYRVKSRNEQGESGWSNPVDVTVQHPQPVLFVSATTLNFDSTESNLTFEIRNVGSGTMTWTVSENEMWISVSPSSGSTTTETDQINVSVNRSGLVSGSYSGMLIMESNGGGDTVEVSMRVSLETYSVADAWWANTVDTDEDDYWSSGLLLFDVNVDSGTRSVCAVIDYKVAGTSTWSPYAVSQNFSITGDNSDDYHAMTIGYPTMELGASDYDFRIRIFVAGAGDQSVAGRDNTSDLELAGVQFEPVSLDQVFTIRDAWWTNNTDDDCDGYRSSGYLNFDANVSSGTHSIYAVVSYMVHDVDGWYPYHTTPNFSLIGSNSSDAYQLLVGSPNPTLMHNSYDFRVEVFLEGTDSPLLARRDDSVDSELSAQLFEVADGPFPVEFQVDLYTVALFHLNDGVGSTLLDASGNDNHGTLVKGTWTVSARFGGGIFLDGIDDYFEIPSPDRLGLQGGYSIEVWVKPFGYRNEPCCSNSTCIFSASREQYEFFIFQPQGQGATRFIPDRSSFMDGDSLQIGGWNYILASVDGSGRARFYVNGELALDAVGVTAPSDSQPINFGRRVSRWFGYFHLNGIIDEIRISNIAREPCP